MNYEIIPITVLRPLEKIFQYHFRNLSQMIKADGKVKQAIIADKKTGIVLDGSHRYVFFLANGYATVPVRFVDYNSQYITVGTRLLHKFLVNNNTGISKDEVIRRGLCGDLFLPRTTRHFFPFIKENISVPLYELETTSPLDISHLIYNSSIDQEITHNKQYLKEIEEETSQAIIYLYSAQQIKAYLTEQIKLMEGLV